MCGTGPAQDDGVDKAVAGLVDHLIGSTIPADDGRLWPVSTAAGETDPCTLQQGSAGVLAVLTRYYELSGDPRLPEVVSTAGHWIARRTGTSSVRPGLHFGGRAPPGPCTTPDAPSTTAVSPNTRWPPPWRRNSPHPAMASPTAPRAADSPPCTCGTGPRIRALPSWPSTSRPGRAYAELSAGRWTASSSSLNYPVEAVRWSDDRCCAVRRRCP